MKIGIDVSSLQGPHRMRGIGYTTSNFLSSIPSDSQHTYILYAHPRDDDSEEYIRNLLTLPKNRFHIRHFYPADTSHESAGQLRFALKVLKKLRVLISFRIGSGQYGKVDDLDAFIQFDQSQPLAKLTGGARNFVVAYDLIPYVLETDYLWGYRVSRQNGRTKRSALKSAFNRFMYIQKIKASSKHADTILAISNATANDFIKYANVPKDKLKLILLGVNRPSKNTKKPEHLIRYRSTSWGYLPERTQLQTNRFLLFVGGADNRRKLTDLIAAFNQLKATGSDIQLVLSGDTMTGPLTIPSVDVQNAFKDTPYMDDIYFLGFTDDDTRNWLYRNALAFVFPSVYEGFGLPVLEAMELETPVICYESTAVKEVAGTVPIYANDTYSLVNAVAFVENMSKDERDQRKKLGSRHVATYSWNKTASEIISYVESSK